MNNSCPIQKLNKPIPSFKNSPVQNTAKSKTFVVKRSFVCIRIKKTQFHINGFALSLALKQRFWTTRKRLITNMFKLPIQKCKKFTSNFLPQKDCSKNEPIFYNCFQSRSITPRSSSLLKTQFKLTLGCARYFKRGKAHLH